MDNQNCRGIGRYSLSFVDKQILNDDIPKPKPSLSLIQSLHWLFLSCQRLDDQRSRNISKKGLFSADEKNLSNGVQEQKLLFCRIKSLCCQSRPSKQLYIELKHNSCC